jgi:hypothetical protein
MAYSPNNPPVPVSVGPLTGFGANEPGAGQTTPKLWMYASADPIATVQGAAYVSDGIQRGLRIGDIVFVFDNNLVRMYITMVVTLTPIPAATSPYGGTQTGSVTLSSTTTPLIN